MKNVLTIAGSDPSGGAGAQADLKVFDAFGVRGLSAITAVTAQNSTVVRASSAVAPALLKKQVEALLEEFQIDSVKVGMLGSAENAAEVLRLFKKYRFENIVLDTVLRSTGGFPLIGEKGTAVIRKMLPFVEIVTPNISEAEAISGTRVNDLNGMEEAARAIRAMGAKNVLVKGGHLEGDAIDLLFDGKRFYQFKGKRIKGNKGRFHGTGCVLSAGVAAGLAKGLGLRASVGAAKRHLERVIRSRG